MRKKLLIALLVYNKSFGALPPKGKTQVMIQGQICEPYEFLQKALDYKIAIQREIIREKQKILKLEPTRHLTDQQKVHRQEQYESNIKELEASVRMIPDSKEEKIIISRLEHSFRENLSLGVQGLLKQNKLLNNKRQRPIEAKIFSQFQFFKWHEYKTTRLFILSPYVILSHDVRSQLGAKVILEKYVHYKKHTSISQIEAGITRGPWGVKYSFGTSRGVKFKNGFLLMIQNFTDIDEKNPIKVYQINLKQIISFAKDNYDQGLSWQIGVFNYTYTKLEYSLYRGVFFSLWRYF